MRLTLLLSALLVSSATVRAQIEPIGHPVPFLGQYIALCQTARAGS
jgi:hypothetical protein